MSAVTPKAEVNSGNLVERFFNKIKQYRRVATRYDKLAANYLAFIKLASIGIWLRANESPRPSVAVLHKICTKPSEDAAKRQPGTSAIRRAGVLHDRLQRAVGHVRAKPRRVGSPAWVCAMPPADPRRRADEHGSAFRL